MELQICKKCLMLSTRPRLTFNAEGVCSACEWSEEKHSMVDWGKRELELRELCDRYRSDNGQFDVIVPASGGKDSSMVAHRLKTQYGMHPLCVNISHHPLVNTEMNEINLNNFVNHGFSMIRIYPNPVIEREMDRNGLIDYGQPYMGWMAAMLLAPIKIGMRFGIPFIMYGEEGEVEYGGSLELKNSMLYSLEQTKRLYLSDIDVKKLYKSATEGDGFSWWEAPSEEEIEQVKPAVAHWSYFHNWNSNENYRYARDHVGLQSKPCNSVGTYNAFAQTDSILYSLHTYFMYLKFGFGRCSQDVCIDIRSGELSREAGIDLIKQYDEAYPEEYEERYLQYYNMTRDEFYAVIDKWANKELLEKRNGRWTKKFDIAKL